MSENTRGRLQVMQELLIITKEMVRLRDDPEFLIQSVDKRQELIDEFEAMRAQDASPLSDEDLAETKRLAQEIAGMDGVITAALEGHRNLAKEKLVANANHRKVVSYLNKTVSSSGNYMDFKK